MIKRGFRSAPSGPPGETPHPKICALMTLGDGIHEPQGLGRNPFYDISGTIIEGAFSGSYARRFYNSGVYTQLCPNGPDYRPYPWTAMFFVRFDASSVDVRVIANNATYGAAIKVTNTKIGFVGNTGSIYAEANVSLSINTWHHVTMSCGAADNQWKIYLNGSPLTLSTNGAAANLGLAGSGVVIYLCRVVSTGVNIDLDHVKAYETQLSDAEVITEMNKRVW